jgi:ornithine carbamoyltransferase/carbamoyltransferase
MLDGLVVRTPGSASEVSELSTVGGLPAVNAMAREEHPTQAICDIATMRLFFGDLDGLTFLYVGEGNNTATALAYGLALVQGVTAVFATPAGYGLPPDVLTHAREVGAGRKTSVVEVHDLDHLPDTVDVVYATRWQTTATTKHDESWREKFRPFYVDEKLLSRWSGARFMHDLPAHRGEDVAGAVLDGPQSIAWSQARMKLTSAMAVLEDVVGGRA